MESDGTSPTPNPDRKLAAAGPNELSPRDV